jgi:hypothetical protein
MSDFTPEEEQAIEDWMFSQEPPPMTAEEYDIELKAAVVEGFVTAANKLVEALDEMEVCGIIGNEFDDLRSIASQAAYVFSGEQDDGRTLEDLS